MNTVDITQMRIQDSGTIVEIHGGAGLIRRLDTMGVRPGVQITKISGQFMQGPVVIKAGNTQVALGYGMARNIRVALSPSRPHRAP